LLGENGKIHLAKTVPPRKYSQAKVFVVSKDRGGEAKGGGEPTKGDRQKPKGKTDHVKVLEI